jgi:hypothetical protein
MKSKIITVSAISSALTAIALTLGAYIEIFDLYCVVISSAFIILPTYYKSYKGSFLCALAGGLIAFMCSGFNIFSIVFLPYFTFFGVFPIVRLIMQEKNFNKIWAYIIGLIWCIAVFYGGYFYYTSVMMVQLVDLPAFIANNILLFVGLIAVVFYVVYERSIIVFKRVVDRYLGRIFK